MTKQQQSQLSAATDNDHIAAKNSGWRARWQALSKAERKKISLLTAALILGLTLMYLADFGNDIPLIATPTTEPLTATPLPAPRAAEEDLESKLTRILSEVNGVGQVSVALSFSEGMASEFVLNTQLTESSSEDTGEGVTLSTTEQASTSKTLAEIDSAPVLIRQIMPQVSGAVIAAEGAEDPATRAKLHRAARVLLDLPAHRIIVLPAQPVAGD